MIRNTAVQLLAHSFHPTLTNLGLCGFRDPCSRPLEITAACLLEPVAVPSKHIPLLMAWFV